MEHLPHNLRIPNDPTGILDPVYYFQKTLACETLQLLAPSQVVACPFWIGLTSPGKWTPQDLLKFSSNNELLQQASEEGIAETESVMLVDSSVQPSRSIFLMMQSSCVSTEAVLEKSRAVLESISAWKPQKIGFYLTESLFSFEDQFHFLTQIFTALSQERQERSYYYLRDANTDYTRTLNLLLGLKEEVALRGGDSFLVLH